MSESPSPRLATLCVHGGTPPDALTHALVPPLVQSTTYAWPALDHPPATTYARSGTPTVEALERRLALLEGGGTAICFGSGLAAIDALLRCLPPKGRIVAGRHLYGGTTRLLQRLHGERISLEFVDTSDERALEAALSTPADLLLVESPSNPTLRITPLRTAAQLARDAGALFAVDNTLLTPLYQRPIPLGADVVVHSTTKYIEGHDATLGGALVVSALHTGVGESPDGSLAARLRWIRKASGAVLAPFEAWLTLQGLKTLHLRTAQQWATAARLAARLRDHPQVVRTYYPGLEDHPGHAIHRQQATGDGGLIGLDLSTFRFAQAFTSRLKVFTLAENLGPVDSLVTHPASMTHGDLPPARRREDGISDALVRLSVGIEDPTDLEEDILQALESAARDVSGRA